VQPVVDELVELLRDCRWHTMEELSRSTKISMPKMLLLTSFLAEYTFAEVDAERKKTRLSKAFAEFLEKTNRLAASRLS
jgi:hypothetical protein